MPDPERPPPKLVLLLMVRDEEDGVERPIRSAAPYVDALYLVDTGSKDQTAQRAQALCEELGIAFWFLQMAWPDSFGQARSMCLGWAARKHPGRTVLFLDADDEVSGTLTLSDAPLHNVEMRMGAIVWTQPRVIHLMDPPRYEGSVHEHLVAGGRAVGTSGLAVRHHSGKPSRPRWVRDKDLLAREIGELDARATQVPSASALRARFYLAQTHECLDELQEAAHQYRAFVTLAQTGPYVVVALLRLALLLERAPEVDLRLSDREAHVLALRLRAHALDPSRPEPLVDAAWAALRARKWAEAYLFARAGEACVPKEDALFLRKAARRNETTAILSQVCFHLDGRLDEGLEVSRVAAQNPHAWGSPWPQANVTLYRTHLNQQRAARGETPLPPFPEESGAEGEAGAITPAG